MKRILGLLLFAVWIFILPGAAGEDIYCDYSADRAGYAKSVAALGQELTASGRGEDTGIQPCLVLCRTKGALLDVSGFSPLVTLRGPKNCYTLSFASQEEAEAFIARVSGLPDVLYAELDQPVRACGDASADADGTEPISFRSWGAQKLDFEPFVRFARRAGTGNASVAVIDSGVYGHPLLSPRITRQGFDYVDQDYDSSNDGTGHGTHVAGIIADCTPGLPVSLIPIRVLDNSGNGRISNVVNAIGEAISYQPSVINLSLQALSHSDAMHAAIQDALNAGIAVILAAGNYGMNVSDVCPGDMRAEGLITVGSVEASGVLSYYTNYGSGVDLYAYGTDITSCSRSGGYLTQSGTSMAAPHIAAAAAILRVLHPGISPSAMEARLKATVGEASPAPQIGLLAPQDQGFSLSRLLLGAGQQFQLPVLAYPAACGESIRWQSADPQVAEVTDGLLSAGSAGETILTASCLGFDPVTVSVRVLDVPLGSASLNAAVIGEEAFADNALLGQIILGDQVTELGSRCFAGCTALGWIRLPEGGVAMAADALPQHDQIVFLCKRDSSAAQLVRDSRWQYILLP